MGNRNRATSQAFAPRTVASRSSRSSAELGESLLQVIGVHYRSDLHIGVESHEERLSERDHVGWVGHVEYDEPCPPPFEGAEVHRLRLPALRRSLEELADAPRQTWHAPSAGTQSAMRPPSR
jgi:hypothetical protein